ncbi:hypothetical protein [Defluviitalea raffinosedens]|uniref:MBL fold metallo-hydrolase n=1 Tax=Defluviitalea raffinosedens TaxID=1450156 RepID=A0A7C8LEL4_9FIRM|nr:hypothetical protein [Defluviitalea raffinosedens]KAE9636897.1 hypothetical protein GND95_00250 [Defluviitalea raffinosedens]MBM7686421.1 beta-lactamase superfamily II metal-dependent hydrolase [Defluviitalea raffinosedens]
MKNRRRFILLVFIFFIIYVYINNILKSKYYTEIHFLKLPTGDCTLIKSLDRNIIIGKAGKKDSKHIRHYLINQKVDHISELIITYPDKDNVIGFFPVLHDLSIDKLYFPQTEDLDVDTKEFLKIAKDKNISIYPINGKEKWEINHWTLLFLRPLINSSIPESERKAIIKFNFPQNSVLWLPDLNEVDKKDILLDSKALKADILKVSGHNREIFLAKDFLDVVQPKTIIFGDSGKINENELRRIYEWNVDTEVLSVEKEGDIMFYGKGNKYNITTKRKMNIRIQ